MRSRYFHPVKVRTRCLRADVPTSIDLPSLQFTNLAFHLGDKVLILKMMLFGIEDRSKCVSLQHSDVGFTQRAFRGGSVRNDIDQALSSIKTAPKVIMFPA
jgi:hypothetical protein